MKNQEIILDGKSFKVGDEIFFAPWDSRHRTHFEKIHKIKRKIKIMEDVKVLGSWYIQLKDDGSLDIKNIDNNGSLVMVPKSDNHIIVINTQNPNPFGNRS